ncbi:hypothetical protein CISIN_1g0074791mg, partial [Citrus sinensis]
VQALCKLLIQNSETLASLEFLHCKLSPSFVEGICRSLCSKRKRIHKIENLSIDISSFIENCPSSVVVELVSFLSSGRSLCSLKLRHCHLDRDFGRMVFSSLLEASSSLSILDLSGNSIGGWLSKYDRSGPLFSLGAGKSLQSLRLLNLSHIAASLGKFFGTSVQVLNIGAIGLGSSGFRVLQDGVTKELKLVNINIRFKPIS